MAEKQIITDINFNGASLKNPVMENLGEAPSNPKEGQVYYDTISKTLMTWNGSEWINSSRGPQGPQGKDGSLQLMSFQINPKTGELISYATEDYNGVTFRLDRETGCLISQVEN